mgnify:CR=1 FL=1
MRGQKVGQNVALLLAVVILGFLPLWLVPAAECSKEGAALFGGADEKGKALVSELAPDYQPWFQPLLEPASAEISSLLFALQAGLGAGVIGYWLGASVMRRKLRAEAALRPDISSAVRDGGQRPEQEIARGSLADEHPSAPLAGKDSRAD